MFLAYLRAAKVMMNEYVFPKKVNGEPVYANYDIELLTPAEGAMTFTVRGQQCALKLTLTTVTSSGISDVTVVRKPDGKIYNLQGMEVEEPLQRGVYIRDGKKFVVR